MNNFLLALQFLTVFPLKPKEFSEKNAAGSMVYFPLVGLTLAVILMVTAKLMVFLGLGDLAICTLVVALLAVLTGGIHLDGLADTSDAFLSRKNKDDMLAIMRDSHIGAMGVLGLIFTVFFKISLLYSLSGALRGISLVLMCVLSRWSMVLSMFLFPYARQEGKAGVFMQGITRSIFILSTVITLLIAFCAWQFKGLLMMLIAGLVAYVIDLFISRKINGLTGDTLGAVNEIIEVTVLFFITILWRCYG